MKTKSTAALLAFILGGLGVHKFYLGQPVQGILYVLLCWTFFPAFIAMIECIVYLTMSQQEFDRRYNGHMVMAQPAAAQMGQNVTINLGTEQLNALQAAPVNVIDELQKLKELHVSGVLTDEEFNVQKQRLLT